MASDLRVALKDMMDAYERRIRSLCTPAELERQPWRCREYVVAEEALAAPSAEPSNVTAMRAALQKIARWRGEFPPALDLDGKPCPYGAAYGSNGERDYMRQVALDALNAPPSSEHTNAAPVPNGNAEPSERLRADSYAGAAPSSELNTAAPLGCSSEGSATATGAIPVDAAVSSIPDSVGEAWAKLAIDMLHELRMDYAPGELKDAEGVKAIKKLRALVAASHERGSVPPAPCSDDLWEDIVDFLRDHEDVVDGSYGESMPNKAMQLLNRIENGGR
ncbi:MAG TPA: hypothetical protein VFA81_10790 [Burkholderiales bacterium]|nr:hypothetical protein [Burkholderiales bacterium]